MWERILSISKSAREKHLFAWLLYTDIHNYFKKGCFSDACFIDRSASCSLNLWLFLLATSPKATANVCF